jgi:7,8-dihydropterin-6-yl-methyl-4-(beta-D-ribofuranosyl)aminobenzene 5'-phosphate synthase
MQAMREIIIKIIYDNCKDNQELQEGWGFSALVEAGDRIILFDTGNDQAAFFSNSKKMGIDYKAITDVVFSHKHHDHTTGCEEILKHVQEGVRVYLPKGFPLKKIPPHLTPQIVQGFVELGPNLFSIALRGGLFFQEQSLILHTTKGLVVVTGCAHAGIVNILKAAQKQLKQPIYCVLGGFHLFRKTKAFVEGVIAQFQSLHVHKVAPCHCSGTFAIGQFQEAYQKNFHKIGTGSIVTIA